MARFRQRHRLVLVRRPRKRDIGLALAQRVEHESDPVEIAVERLEQLHRARHGRVVDIEARLHQVHELAKAHCAGHPRAALERMERASQLASAGVIAGRTAPCAHPLTSLRIEFRRPPRERSAAPACRRRRVFQPAILRDFAARELEGRHCWSCRRNRRRSAFRQDRRFGRAARRLRDRRLTTSAAAGATSLRASGSTDFRRFRLDYLRASRPSRSTTLPLPARRTSAATGSATSDTHRGSTTRHTSDSATSAAAARRPLPNPARSPLPRRFDHLHHDRLGHLADAGRSCSAERFRRRPPRVPP